MADEITPPLSTADAEALIEANAAAKAQWETDSADILKRLKDLKTLISKQRAIISSKFFARGTDQGPADNPPGQRRYPEGVKFYRAGVGSFKPGNGGWVVNFAKGNTQAEDVAADNSAEPKNADWIIPAQDRDVSVGIDTIEKSTDAVKTERQGYYGIFSKGYQAQGVINGVAQHQHGWDLSNITVFLCDEIASTLTVPNLRYYPKATAYFEELDRLKGEYNKAWAEYWDKRAAYNSSATDTTNSLVITNSDGTLNQTAIAGYKYNVGTVTDAYFSSKTSWKAIFDKFGAAGSNSPVLVGQASQLWETSKANKGMIQIWTQQIQNGNTPILSTPGTTAPGSPQAQDINQTIGPRGFQFHYNPASVDMQYSGMAGVDANFEASGLDKFNMLGVPAGTTSTVSFSILVNRVFDLQHYDPKTGRLKGYNAETETMSSGSQPYSPRMPKTWEQDDIYNKGTMYDVEALLRVLVGWTINPYMGARASFEDGKTADMGFLIGRPIELHLGKSLRYVGYIGSISVNHVLFDERMVPLFTNIGFAFNRIPDYANPVPKQEGTGGVQTYNDSMRGSWVGAVGNTIAGNGG